MASPRHGRAVTALAAVALSVSAGAQDHPAFRTGVDLVTVPVVVTDQRGVHVASLRRSDFHVLDNGEEREITGFWPASGVPLTLGIVIDSSDSQRTYIREHESAARQFLEHVLRPGERGFIVRVAHDVTLNWEGIRSAAGFREVLLPASGQPLGQPCGQLAGRSLCGGTALWNAVYATARLKFGKAEGSKALVVLSDGADTGSTHSLAEAIRECNRTGVNAYAIRTSSAPGLTQLAQQTGGADFDPPAGNFAPVFARIEADLRSQYILGFQAAAGASGEVHKIVVQVRGPGVVIRSRTEYAVPEHK